MVFLGLFCWIFFRCCHVVTVLRNTSVVSLGDRLGLGVGVLIWRFCVFVDGTVSTAG